MNDFLLLNLVFFGVLTVAAYALSFALTYSAGQSKKFPMQDWRAYGKAMLALHFVGFIILFLMLCWQHVLPWNPLQLPGLAWDRAFNIAISFVSQTNWQSYQGEITLSPFTQMAGLTVQNFLSAAIGMTAGMVILRAVAYPAEKGIGNFWADLRASILYILLPLSFVLAIFLLWQGVPQSFQAYQPITTLEGQAQLLPLGNAASQIAIKQVGDNGGGFYGANSAHPFENPTALSNFVEMLAMLLLSGAFLFAFGKAIRNQRQAWVFYAVVLLLLLAGGVAIYTAEAASLVSWEGKEWRFNLGEDALWASITTATGNGSVNAAHDSFMPLSVLVMLLHMLFDSVVFGAGGTGFVALMVFVILSVFMAGLMVGRSPEFLGKKITAAEIKWCFVFILALPLVAAGFTVWAMNLEAGRAAMGNPGMRGFSEILYAYTSAAANNGSALGGIKADVPFYNITMGVAMLLGRFFTLLPALALAGHLAPKPKMPPSLGTLRTDTFMFATFLLFIIVLFNGLTAFPLLLIGPVVEHLAGF